MTRKLSCTGSLLLVAAALSACRGTTSTRVSSSPGLIPGVVGNAPSPAAPGFDLYAGPGAISTSDGDSMFMWLYGVAGGTVQYPGPTLIVQQGAQVTLRFTNQLPVASSIAFPGMSVTASGGVPGLVTNEAAANGGTVSYTFTADRPGTFLYHSGTRADLQVEMGLAGAILVRPTGFADVNCTAPGTPCRKAYGDLTTAYDREYLFFLTEADPLLHQKVAFAPPNEVAAGFPSIDTTQRHATDWFINGRNFPDTVTDAGVPWFPMQPYNAFPRMHPGEKVLMRMASGGQDLHPFHTHGQNHLVIARDARLLSSNVLTTVADPPADLALSDFTTTAVPGETIDAIWGPWTGAKLGWDIFGTAAINAHGCTPDPTGFDPTTREYCADHYKPIPVTLPPDPYVHYGPFYGGTPYMGVPGVMPPLDPDGTVHVQQNPQAGLGFMWHSHSERELTTNDIFIGGMATMALVLPVGTAIP
jgi:FtsP/CotA-like multicopper oxidase with cupredoxin domain